MAYYTTAIVTFMSHFFTGTYFAKQMAEDKEIMKQTSSENSTTTDPKDTGETSTTTDPKDTAETSTTHDEF